MDENEFELNGVVYIAVNEPVYDEIGCAGCCLDCLPETCMTITRPRCTSENRKDGRNVIFVGKLS